MSVPLCDTPHSDVEAGSGSHDPESNDRLSGVDEIQAAVDKKIFPMELFKCLPSSIKAFIPSAWLKIQDRTHLTLVVGTLTSLFIVIGTIPKFTGGFHHGCMYHFCYKEIVSLLFITPCIIYFTSIISRYDEDLQEKQKSVGQKKEHLMQAYNVLIDDMDGLLSRSAESSAGLAERGFESKRRDFQRFLERARTRYDGMFDGSKGEQTILLKQFRLFVGNWLRVFEECSIDPVDRPKAVLSKEELERCATPAEIADLALARLKVSKVQFISAQRDLDQDLVKKTRASTTIQQKNKAKANADVGFLTTSARNVSVNSVQTENKFLPSWLQFQPKSGCGLKNDVEGQNFPKTLACVCCKAMILSRDHFLLNLGFVVGNFLVVYELCGGNWPACINSIIQVWCLAVVLVHFESIDFIQRLELEVRELTQANNNIEEQKAKMNEFWTNAQNLTDLWLYRTMPRLDLIKEVHSRLEDVPAEDLLTTMSCTNMQLDNLEKNLGALEAWRADGDLHENVKKQFGTALSQVVQYESDIGGLLKKVEVLNRNGALCLTGPPTAQSPS